MKSPDHGATHIYPRHIFREYDVRGIAGSEIDEAFSHQAGKAFAAMLPENDPRPVVVGRDVRLSSPALHAAAIGGLADAGRDVLDLGMAPTPLAYYAVHTLDTAGCLMVTASHNPGEYNGFKMMRGLQSMHGEDIRRLQELMSQNLVAADIAGDCEPLDIIDGYMDFVVNNCALSRPLKVVIDAGNGPSGIIAGPLYRRLGCEVIELYCEPDGAFPNHHPDPTVAENLQDLAACVRGNKADLGIAFDGDGDRIGVVDCRGEIVPGDMLLLLLSQQLLATSPGATIISEVKSSDHLYNGIRAAGGRPVMWRTGHSPIKAKMRETGALLAGEMSGHLFFADRYYGFDDAVYAGARVMQMLADANCGFETMLKDVPRSISTPEIRLPCSDAQKQGLVKKAMAHFSSAGYRIIDIDGMRIQFDDGWGLLRASNTQPALVMRFEAPDHQRLQEMRRLIEGWLENRLRSG